MRGRLARLAEVGAAILLVAVLIRLAPQDRPEGLEHESDATGELEDDREAPDDWFLSQRATFSGVPPAALSRAHRQADRIAALTAATSPTVAAAPWEFVGPTNVGGRVLDIAVDPAAPSTVYVAAASGGVWKSTDGGQTLQQALAGFPQAIGALAATSDGTLFAGTGEAGPGGGSITYGGNGVYRSIDGAATWRRLGLARSGNIGRIVVDPSDPRRIFVAAAGDLFNPGGQRGVFRSTDGGQSWARVLTGDTTTTGAVDLAMNPDDPQQLFAAMWDHRRLPDRRVYGGVGSGIYRSEDGGETWGRLGNGLPGPSAGIGRIGIAVAPQLPTRVYAIVIRTDGTFEGFYRSEDGGDAWTKLPHDGGLAGSQATYGWWFGRLWVAPDDPAHVLAGGVTLEESANSGASWGIEAGNTHVDHHAMAWAPSDPTVAYLGNDGGLYRSTTGGQGGWTHGAVQPFTQFYSVDVSEQDLTRVVGGTQDNSALRSWPGNWNAYVGGDGEQTLIDPTNQQKIYGCFQYGSCYRSTDGGNSVLSFGGTVSDRYNWFTPVQFDPSDPRVMYLGGNRLNRSTNSAQSFQVISPDLTGGPGPDPAYPFGTITTVAAARTDPDRLLVGTDDGRVWYTTDLGNTWTRSQDPDIPGHWVTRVAFDQTDPAIGYATFSGYRGGDNGPYVLRTADGGATWSDVTGNLPGAPVNDVVADGAAVYVATDTGVYRTTNGGVTWLRLGTGLPRVPVDDIELRVADHSLYAGTFGRGVYRVTLP